MKAYNAEENRILKEQKPYEDIKDSLRY